MSETNNENQATDNFAHMEELRNQIHTHSAWLVQGVWRNLNRTFNSIFALNYMGLIGIWDAPNASDELQMELIQNVHEPVVREAYEDECIKSFHNYMSGTFTLIGHSQRFIKEYVDTDFFLEYEKRRLSLLEETDHEFLQGLRNYILHFDIPPIGYNIQLRVGVNSELAEPFTPMLGKSSLLSYSKWTSKAKAFIINYEDQSLAIRPIVERHADRIKVFYDWIFRQFEILHHDELQELRAIQAELGKYVPPEVYRDHSENRSTSPEVENE